METSGIGLESLWETGDKHQFPEQLCGLNQGCSATELRPQAFFIFDFETGPRELPWPFHLVRTELEATVL